MFRKLATKDIPVTSTLISLILMVIICGYNKFQIDDGEMEVVYLQLHLCYGYDSHKFRFPAAETFLMVLLLSD